MISVIIVTYNQEQYIEQNIKAVLMQKVDEPIEIIIGNDDSTDSTKEICTAYANKYPQIHLINNHPNMGGNENFLNCLKFTNGDYIAGCDGDDYWTDEYKLQKQVDYFRSHPQCVLLHTKSRLFDGKKFYNRTINESEVTSRTQLLINNYINSTTLMYRRSLLLKNIDWFTQSFFKYHWKMLDYPIALTLGLEGEIGYINDDTAVYRVLPNTMSHLPDKERQYMFDASTLDIKTFFYVQYQSKDIENVNTSAYRFRFHEMEFHARKRMLLTYGWMAREQLLPLLKLLPYYPMILKHSIQGKLKKTSH